ncbi:MAG: hypothetical protein M3Q48_06230, partial [Actinomycetota bacterium]|nr:hypothetical protein [Actinomycetota bacterium]
GGRLDNEELELVTALACSPPFPPTSRPCRRRPERTPRTPHPHTWIVIRQSTTAPNAVTGAPAVSPPANRPPARRGQFLGAGALDGSAEQGQAVLGCWPRQVRLNGLDVVAHDVDAVGLLAARRRQQV